MIGRMTGFAVLLMAVCACVAQQATPRVVVHAGKLVDVKTGKLLSDQVVVIQGDKIASVGPASEVTPSSSDKIIDLPHATVLPGLIDVHTHLTGDPELWVRIPCHFNSERSSDRRKECADHAKCGIHHRPQPGASGYTDVALRDAINAGDVPGPRMLVSGPALGITGGHCDNNLLPFEYHVTDDGVADGVPGVQHKVREVIKYGADLIKICATGGVLSKGDDPQASQYTLEEMKAIVADAHRLGRKVAAHAHGAQGILWASEAGVDSVEHCSYINDEAIAALKKNGTYLVPTLYLSDWLTENMQKVGMPEMYAKKMRDIIPVVRQNVGHAFANGVKVAFGTDAAVYPHGLNAHEFAVYVKLGMTPAQAIQTATVNAADLLGWSDKVGSLEAGKWADLIAVDGDPLQDVTRLQQVRFVMKGGAVVKNDYGKL